MKTLTRDEATAELAALPGYSELTARNVLFEATKAPYATANDGRLFVAVTTDGRFLIADIGIPFGASWPAGDEFAALLNEAAAAGARLPGWADTPR